MNFPNKAGDHADNDSVLRSELHEACIQTMQEDEGRGPEWLADILRSQSGEVKSSVVGMLHGWTFKRAWYYWVAEGPGIDFERSMNLWRSHGMEVRASGDCACRSPVMWYKGMACGLYHVDTSEGLKALADTINAQVAYAQSVYSQHIKESS